MRRIEKARKFVPFAQSFAALFLPQKMTDTKKRRRRRCRWLGRGARFCICSRFLLRGVEDCTN